MKVCRKGQRGYTMLEVLAVATISSVLAVGGAPMLKSWQTNLANRASQDQFTEALEGARALAIASGQNVTLCASDNGRHCNTNDWSGGWIIYQKAMEDSVREEDSGLLVLHNYRLENIDSTLRVFDERLKPVNEISFNPNGFNAHDEKAIATLCTVRSQLPIAILVERSGHVHRSHQWFDQLSNELAQSSGQPVADLQQSLCQFEYQG